MMSNAYFYLRVGYEEGGLSYIGFGLSLSKRAEVWSITIT